MRLTYLLQHILYCNHRIGANAGILIDGTIAIKNEGVNIAGSVLVRQFIAIATDSLSNQLAQVDVEKRAIFDNANDT